MRLSAPPSCGHFWMVFLGGVAATALAACSEEPKLEGQPVDCALGQNQPLTQKCVVEIVPSSSEGQGAFIIRHIDGHFQRFAIDRQGDILAADGMHQPEISETGGVIEIQLGRARYSLPRSALGLVGD